VELAKLEADCGRCSTACILEEVNLDLRKLTFYPNSIYNYSENVPLPTPQSQSKVSAVAKFAMSIK
jgi:hypothetical protein